MPKPQVIALALSPPYPPLPTAPAPAPSPLQTIVEKTAAGTDYDAVVAPLTNSRWRERWERLCLRPIDEEEAANGPTDEEREKLDFEADLWRREGGLNRDELVVSRLEETQTLIATAADWLELDSPDEGIRFDSELALRAEMAQALYLALPVLIVPAPSLANRAYLSSYARAIANLLQIGGPTAFTQISIRIPVSDPTELIHQGPANPAGGVPSPNTPTSTGDGKLDMNDKLHKRMSSMSTRPTSVHYGSGNGNLPILPIGARIASGASAASGTSGISAMSGVSGASMMSARSTLPAFAKSDPSSTWEMWDAIRRLCNYHPRLSVTLDLTNPLPPSIGALSRWTAEPIKNIWLPASSFIANAKGYPVLSKASQAFLRGLSRQYPTIILSQTTPARHPSGGSNAYLQYVRHITNTSAPSASTSALASSGANARIPENGAADFTAGYADFLQAPLQPLMDNLGSATYDVFERDPVKYRQYEEAIFLALSDLPADKKHVLLVVGAGRGPLVTCALTALQKSGRKAKIYAVDKNIGAFTTLQERKAVEWHDAVDIIFGDMRSINVPELADIMISELLGSFGDNELSPECLDGAMRFLKPEGVSIPISYTAHLAPISSTKLYSVANAPGKSASAAETPYVVMMSAVNIVSGEGGGPTGRCGERIQQCWQFEHPRRDLILDPSGVPLTNSHNTRSSHLTFYIPHAGPLHGLAGYFEAHLYGNVGLSIHPETAHRVSPDMFSWFPLYFPLREPVYLPSGAELDVSIWRLWDGTKRKVWYEWSAEVYLPVAPISAPSPVGLSPMTPKTGPNGLPSPMMDAAYSPAYPTAGSGWPNTAIGGSNGTGTGTGPETIVGRIKIGQTALHNVGGAHSWVGL